MPAPTTLPTRGSSATAAAAPSTSAPKKAQPSLADENEKLRRENAELRQQLLHLMAAAAPPTGTTPPAALPAPFWLEAQLKHARRQVQLLSDALVLKAEITADVEQVLRDLLKLQPSTQNEKLHAFCRGALRKLRGVDFAQQIAEEVKENGPKAPPTTRARTRASGTGTAGSGSGPASGLGAAIARGRAPPGRAPSGSM